MRRFISKFLPQNPFLQKVVLLASGTASGQAVILLCAPLLTRLYTPQEFGVLAVFTSIVGILGGIANLRYELAIPLCKNDQEASATLLAAMLTCLAMTLSIVFLTALFRNPLADLLNITEFAGYLWLVPPTVFVVGMHANANHWAIRDRDISLMSTCQLAVGFGRVIPQIALGFAGSGVFGLLIGQACGFAIGTLMFWLAWYHSSSLPKIGLHVQQAWSMAKRYRRFAVFSSPSTLLNGIARLTPAMFLAALYNAEIAGWYGFAQLAIGAPIQLLAMAVAQVYLSEAPKMRDGRMAELRGLFLSTSSKLLGVGAVCLACMAIPGPWLFSIVFGASWEESGRIIQLLAPLYLLRFVVVPISQTLNMFERQDLVFMWDLANVAILILSFAAGYALELHHLTTITIYSLSMTASYALHFMMAFWVIDHHAKHDSPKPADTPLP